MRLLAALWVVMVVGCGNVSPVKPDGGAGDDAASTDDAEVDAPPVGPMDYAIAVDPASLTLPIASSGTINITITRNNFSDTITLAAVNVPSGVSVTFEPATLAAGVNASVATVAIAGGIAEGSGTFTIDANAGLRQKSATVAVDWHRITVSGTVQNGAANITVVMPGRTPITTTSGGAFTFTDVTPPYDLYTVSSAGFIDVYKYIYYYKGLTRTDPVLTYASFGFIANTAYSATLNGSISGHPGYPNTWVGWGNNGGTPTPANTTTTMYQSLNATWPQSDGTPKAGNLHALAWSTNGAGQTNQIHYGTTAATLMNGTTYAGGTAINITLAQATTATLSGTITAPSGFGTPTLKVWQNVGLIGKLMVDTTGTAVSALIPVIAAGKSTFSTSATGGGATSIMAWPDLDANTDVSFTLVDPAVLQAPANAATGVTTSTDFNFTGPANHVHVFSTSSAGATKVVYTVYTTDSTARIPNVSQSVLPSGQAFSWSVQSYGPDTHVNAAATATGLRYPGEGLPSGSRRTYTASASRSFTSQ